jgi:hypothetical protein
MLRMPVTTFLDLTTVPFHFAKYNRSFTLKPCAGHFWPVRCDAIFWQVASTVECPA